MTQPNRRRNGIIVAAIALALLLLAKFAPPPLLATNLFQSPPPSPIGLGTLSIPIKVFLQGPYNATNGLMNNTLRTQNLVPMTEPYSSMPRFGHRGGEMINPSVFSITGRNAIVDWVLVELRSAGNPTLILTTRAALIQRDGDVVDMDGASPVMFVGQSPGNYYVAVEHRNHLRVMTAAAIPVNTTSSLIDFTNSNTAIYGNYAQTTIGSVRALLLF